MSDCTIFADKIKELLKTRNLSAAKEELAIGLEKFPDQIKLLTIATNVYRASGDHKKSLEYAELLITHHPDDWNGYYRAAQDLFTLKRFEQAQEKLQAGLERFPDQINLLIAATNAYRASGDHKKSLEYAEILITHHPDNWNGYYRAAQDLFTLKRFEQAQEKLQAGLEKIPNQIKLLTIATNIYRASGDREKSLEHAELLITHHPDDWNGYYRAAQDLFTLKRPKQAQEKIQAGLEKIPNQINLLRIATNVYRASGDREKSLEHAELLITHHPDDWNGYYRAAQDLFTLKRLEQAQEKIQAGLEKIPNQINLLRIAAKAYRTSGEIEKSLGYIQLLITHHRHDSTEYMQALKDLIALKEFDQAQKTIEASLNKFPNDNKLLNFAAEFYSKNFNQSKLKSVINMISADGNHLEPETGKAVFFALSKWADENLDKQIHNRTSWTLYDKAIYSMKFILSNEQIPFNLIYAPKNACTTIKNSLLRNATPKNCHSQTYKLQGKLDLEKQFVILTRNPYKRFISAYFNKIGPGKDPYIWRRMCTRYGFEINKTPSMGLVLDKLISDKFFHEIDPHFQPQSILFCPELITPSIIYRMEDMSTFKDFLHFNSFHLSTYDNHSTKISSCQPNDLDDATIRKLQEFYEKDFANYEYSIKPEDFKQIPQNIVQKQYIHPMLKGLKESCIESMKSEQFNDLTKNLIGILSDNTDEEKSKNFACAFFQLTGERLS